MNTLNIETFIENMTYYVNEAQLGKIFVYPTDTIYGIGGIVTADVVTQINQCKQRLPDKHYSIIAPNITRIQKYMDVSDEFATQRNDLRQQYGPLTLLLKPRNLLPSPSDDEGGMIGTRGMTESEKVLWGRGAGGEGNPLWHLLSPTNLIGVRLIDHPLQQWVDQLGQPLITTSANISGQPSITHISQLQTSQHPYIDYIIDGGELLSAGSTVIDYHTGQIIRSATI